MTASKDFKRENFHVSPEQEAQIDYLQELLRAPTRKDAVLRAVDLTIQLVCEIQSGNQLYIKKEQKSEPIRILMPGLDKPATAKWKYLVEVPHSWRRQLVVKGSRLRARTVWGQMIREKLTREEAADNWDLPLEAIDEIVRYCEENKKLLEMEADEEAKTVQVDILG